MGTDKSEDPITRKFNATNAKRIAMLMVMALVAYHGILHLSYGLFEKFNLSWLFIKIMLPMPGIKSCKWLLSDGSFHGFGSYAVWQV